MNWITASYTAYLAISLVVTVLVGKTLHHHGRPFLLDVFHGKERRAEAVNHLLLVGFYLTNLAFVLFLMRTRARSDDLVAAIELVSGKMSIVFTALGLMHFVNVAVLMRVRRALRSQRAGGPF